MPHDMQQAMRTAMQLMREGDLAAATAILQGNLAAPPQPEPDECPAVGKGRCIDSVARVVPESANEDVADGEPAPARSGVDQVATTGTFACRHGSRDYLMYAPREPALQPAPLLLMLHGCTQSAADFARGTRMHAKAAAEGYVVVYAAQASRHNPNVCWNWFRAADQQREQGEPAILAGMVQDVVRRFGCDRGRVHVAGLSAGAAMALNLARLYPELFRGVGVHSGLPFGCAQDVPSAMAAMRSGGTPRAVSGGGATAPSVPTIVFHGDRDTTVSVRNASRIVGEGASEAADHGGPWETVTTARGADRFGFTTTRMRGPSGRTIAERWIVHGAGHAWFGGSGEGSYTDPRGPDATTEMLRFFRELA